jgi:protein arginine N-methyltransferase 3
VQHVDVIISEWMVSTPETPVTNCSDILHALQGYMLLYEAMLDSVLQYVPRPPDDQPGLIFLPCDSARDRFLAPGGLMVPSQTRIILAGITGQQLWDEGFGFWDNVYGRR